MSFKLKSNGFSVKKQKGPINLKSINFKYKKIYLFKYKTLLSCGVIKLNICQIHFC